MQDLTRSHDHRAGLTVGYQVKEVALVLEPPRHLARLVRGLARPARRAVVPGGDQRQRDRRDDRQEHAQRQFNRLSVSASASTLR